MMKELKMTVSEARVIIERVREENGFGLLELLEIMHDEREAGKDFFNSIYSKEERQAYDVMMTGFYQLFHGA